MSLYNPMPKAAELNFRMNVNNLLCAVKRLLHFAREDMGQKRRERLVNFSCSVGKIFLYKKWLIKGSEYVALNEKEKILQRYCDEIVEILFGRRNDLKNMKINSDDDYFLFLEKFFVFLLSEENFPNFIDLIHELANGSNIFSQKDYYEKNRKWLDNFELRI